MTPSAKSVRFDDDSLWVGLDDGRVVGVPLAWFPRLLAATAEQRAGFELSPRGIHWEALDEDTSIDGLLAGHGDRPHVRSGAAAESAGTTTACAGTCHEARFELPVWLPGSHGL